MANRYPGHPKSVYLKANRLKYRRLIGCQVTICLTSRFKEVYRKYIGGKNKDVRDYAHHTQTHTQKLPDHVYNSKIIRK